MVEVEVEVENTENDFALECLVALLNPSMILRNYFEVAIAFPFQGRVMSLSASLRAGLFIYLQDLPIQRWNSCPL
jgi:hypothetical protein